MKPLTPTRADRVLSRPSQMELPSIPSRTSVAQTALWGTKAIAAFIGLSPDSVRRIIKRDPTFPARLRGGRTYADRIEILDWLKPRNDEPS